GNDFRSIPQGVPDLTQRNVPPAQQRGYARQFHNIWSPESKSAPPNFGVNFSVGDTFGPLGVALGTIYTTEYQRRPGEFQENFTTQRDSSGNVIINDQLHETLTFDRSTFLTRLGALLTSGYKLDNDNKLSFRALVDRNSSDEVANGTGHDRNISDEIAQWRLQYREEQLGFGQLAGEHHFSLADLSWRTALSQTTQMEPDTRFITYDLNPDGRKLFLSGEGPESAERLFGDLSEYLTDSSFDVSVPFKTALPFTDVWSGLPAKFKFGPAYSYRDRTFAYRRFVSKRLSNTPPADLFSQAPEIVLDPDNVGRYLTFEEQSKSADSFDATQEIAAMYGMFDLPLIQDRLRLVAGVRMEYSYIHTSSVDISSNQPIHSIVNDLTPLPGANLIYSLRDDMNLRYGYSRSVSRPEFRELTPTQFVVPNGERPVIGNQFLQSADIESHDVRWEWFMSPAEILSFGLFYKHLTHPIEQTVISQSAGEADSFTNADDANLWGFEFEERKNLGFALPQLADFNFLTNVAYIDSTAHIPKQPGQAQTSTSRALQGQAPFVVNAALEYVQNWGTIRLLYNTIGDRIVAAGVDGLPDVFEQQRNEVDAVFLAKINPFGTPLTAKLALENLLNDPYVQTQGDRLSRKYDTGAKVTLGVVYTY
ncbi:MAG TPA: TonB-dependent receptor, partial [Candidatus Acidoferrales bacterium]|nr:TonB-dependent receptor [Candidatus Acidoferrales bacterium]